MARWIAKGVASAIYWLFVGYLLTGLFMGDPVTPQPDRGPAMAWLTVVAVVLGWAMLSWIWDRIRARRS